MIHYPLTFDVEAHAASGISTTWSTRAQAHMTHEIPAAIPPEFEGPGQGLSPEDLYALALTNCFIATFKVFAEKSKVSFREILAQTRLSVDRDEKGHPWMARADLKITLSGASDAERARRLLEKTSQSCLVLNSVRTQKSFEFQLQD